MNYRENSENAKAIFLRNVSFDTKSVIFQPITLFAILFLHYYGMI